MTEAVWLNCADLGTLMGSFIATGYDRKARLFSCACVRRAFVHLPDLRSRRAVNVLERYVDGLADWSDVESAYRDAAVVGANSAAYLASEEPFVVALRAAADIAKSPISRATEEGEQCGMLRCIFGNPFRPVSADPRWLTSAVVGLARTMYESRDFSPMPVLADALEEAGCDNPDVLAHCRGDGAHVRGCFVVDLLLGKE